MPMLQKTVVPGVSMWSVWQPDRGLHFNAFLVETADGNFAVDPLPVDEATMTILRERGVQAVVVTNRDHERASGAFAAALGASIVVGDADAPSLSVTVDRRVGDGDDVYGWRVVTLDGFKTPGEMVLYHPALRASISGDAFWGDPAGSLRFMPDDKLADPAAAAHSAKRVLTLDPLHMLVGDGAPVFGNAAHVLRACLTARESPLKPER